MALLDPSDTSPWKTALLEVVWAQDQARGGFFVDELLRTGNLTIEDMQTIRTAYQSYKTTRNNRPSSTPIHEDTGAAVHGTTDIGQTPGAGR